MTTEREITEHCSLTLPNGRLNRDAVGWMRRPLLDTSGIGRGRGPLRTTGWGRNKRWEYWCVITPTHILGLTVSSIDYAGVHEVWAFDRQTQESIGQNAVVPLARGVTLPPSLGDGSARASAKNLTIEVDEIDEADAAATRLRATTARVRVDVVASRPPGHEALGVVVPWSDSRFQYTVKDVARPVSGSLWIDDIEVTVPEGRSWAVLDHGRGRWPYDVRWNWGAASGMFDHHVIGIQIGGQWTVDTGSTENAFLLDGQLHKISDELVWQYDTRNYLAPWHMSGPTIDLTFEPFFNKQSRTNFGVIQARTDQCFGAYSGTFTDASGSTTSFSGIEGWAEDVHNRW